jgi:rod shape-determining protein MreC
MAGLRPAHGSSNGLVVSRYRNILFLVSVLVLQIIGLAVQVRRPNPTAADASSVRLIRFWAIGLMSPPEKALHGTGTGVRGLWSNYLDLRHVRDENKQLRDQVSRLQLEQASLLEDARQGQRLQSLLAFKEHYIYSTVPAQVIGTAGTDQSRVLYIDKGAKDGLKPDMAVITPDGIVGKLKDVFGHTSQVLVINDQTSGAGVLLESTRLRGVLRGNALGQPQIINMLPDERVKPGERVITSGGDQIYPRGLPVGVVDKIVPDTQNPPYIDIVIKPAANLGHLEELLVISQASEQMPEKEKQDLAQSAAEGAAVGRQRASDVLAERLPGLNDPDALANPGAGKPHADAAAAALTIPPPLHPPPALHADHFSPDATPPATALTPGQAVIDQKYAPEPGARPVAAAKPHTGAPVAAAGDGQSQPPVAKTKVTKTTPNTTSQGATSVTPPAVAKPKVPKTTPAEAPPSPPPTTPDGGNPQ